MSGSFCRELSTFSRVSCPQLPTRHKSHRKEKESWVKRRMGSRNTLRMFPTQGFGFCMCCFLCLGHASLFHSKVSPEHVLGTRHGWETAMNQRPRP